MKYNNGSNINMSDKDKEKIESAMNSKEAQELKKAIQRNGSDDVEALKAAFSTGNMEKTKEIMQKLFADEKCAKALQELEKKFSGK